MTSSYTCSSYGLGESTKTSYEEVILHYTEMLEKIVQKTGFLPTSRHPILLLTVNHGQFRLQPHLKALCE